MTTYQNLKDALSGELERAVRWELHLHGAYCDMALASSHPSTQRLFQRLLVETAEHVRRLSELHKSMLLERKSLEPFDTWPSDTLRVESYSSTVIDSVLIGTALRMEQFAMAGYAAAIEMSRVLANAAVERELSKIMERKTEVASILRDTMVKESLPRALSAGQISQQFADRRSANEVDSVAHPIVRRLVALLILLGPSCAAIEAYGDNGSGMQQNSSEYPADNSARNKRDIDTSSVTPEDQSSAGPDVALVAELRRQILNNKQLSINAHNVKIIARNNTLTLRGPVASSEERVWIGKHAAEIGRGYTLNNQLEIAQ